MMTRRTRRRLWLTSLALTAVTAALCLLAGLHRLSAAIAAFQKVAALQNARQQGRALRPDVAHLFAAQLEFLRQDPLGPLDEYHARRDGLRRRIERLTRDAHVPRWSPGLLRQFEAWSAQAATAFAERSADGDEPRPQTIALLTRQGNQMLVMLAVLDGEWASWSDDLMLHGRCLRREATWLGAGAAASAVLTAVCAVGWLRAGRRR